MFDESKHMLAPSCFTNSVISLVLGCWACDLIILTLQVMRVGHEPWDSSTIWTAPPFKLSVWKNWEGAPADNRVGESLRGFSWIETWTHKHTVCMAGWKRATNHIVTFSTNDKEYSSAASSSCGKINSMCVIFSLTVRLCQEKWVSKYPEHGWWQCCPPLSWQITPKTGYRELEEP